jgi:hypothetical protein
MSTSTVSLPTGYTSEPGQPPIGANPKPELANRSILCQHGVLDPETGEQTGALVWLYAPQPLYKIPDSDPTTVQAVDVVFQLAREENSAEEGGAWLCCVCKKAGTKESVKTLNSFKTRDGGGFKDAQVLVEWPVCGDNEACRKAAEKLKDKYLATEVKAWNRLGN